jgi:glycine cleavage system regulatory protein
MGSMRVAVQDTQPWLADDDAPHRQEGVTFAGCLNATGPDAPGILSRITTMLAEQQLDITALQCHQHQQKKQQSCNWPWAKLVNLLSPWCCAL